VEYLKPKDGQLPFAILVFCFLTNLTVLHASPVPVVRVMVERENKNILIEGFDLVFREGVQGKSVAHVDRRAAVPLSCDANGKLELRTSLSKKIKITPPLRVQSLGGFIRIHGRQYRDDLYVYGHRGDCVVVNHVDLEKYVAGLLNSEMSVSWNLNALKAQAVAARTYALYQMSLGNPADPTRSPFDLESTVRDQVYEGAHKERYKALKAVQETRGQILTFKNQPVKAFYHSTCGGETENADRVWGARYPYLRPVKCGYCNNSPRFQWTYEVSQSELEKKLLAKNLLKGSLKGIRVIERNSIGRAAFVEVIGSGGKLKVKGTELRDALGSVHLRSTDFRVTASLRSNSENKTIRPSMRLGNWVYSFRGSGSGHGVGMCQYGAKGQGDAGKSYAQILRHYYPLTSIKKIY